VAAHLQQLRAANTLPPQAVALLNSDGFLTIPGPFSGKELHNLAEAYEQATAEASGPDLKIGGSTIRMSDLLSFHSLFDEVFLYPPLLEACSHITGEAFKLSSFLARTLRPGTPAQELHADLSRTSEDAPLFLFILSVDAFREETGRLASSLDRINGPMFRRIDFPTFGRHTPTRFLHLGNPER
jgi:hypothetical protein